MTEPRQIAVVNAESGYDGLHQAFRARFEELGIKRDAIDELAGLTRGHASKILSPYPMKAIGRTTLGPILYAAKLKLIVVVDEDIEWANDPGVKCKYKARAVKPLKSGVANLPEIRSLQRKSMRSAMQKNGRKGGLKSVKSRMSKFTAAQRSRIARRAARTRLKRQRAQRRAQRCAPVPTLATGCRR